MKRLLLVALLAAPGLALAGKLDRLDPDERAHYDALRVFMTDKEQKLWLKTKDRAARDAWLRERGLWNRYYQYDEEMRKAIADGNVAVGWTEDRVLMAWGPPTSKRRLARPTAQRSEALIYFFEVTPTGRVLVWEPGSKLTHSAVDRFRVEVVLDDGVVAELSKRAGWD